MFKVYYVHILFTIIFVQLDELILFLTTAEPQNYFCESNAAGDIFVLFDYYLGTKSMKMKQTIRKLLN